MSQSIFVCVALVVLPLTFACDKSGAAAQADVNKVQEQENKDLAKGADEARVKALATQAEADKKIGAVQADFARLREDYRHEMQGDLDSLNKSVTELEAKDKTATGKVKADLDAVLPSLEVRRDTFMDDLRAIESANVLTWDSTKARLDKEWSELKLAADKAAG